MACCPRDLVAAMALREPPKWVELKDNELQPHWTERCEVVQPAVDRRKAKIKVWVERNYCGIEEVYSNPRRLRRHSSATPALCHSKVKGGMGGWRACKKIARPRPSAVIRQPPPGILAPQHPRN